MTALSTHRPRLLAIGDGNAPTGFGRVMHNVLTRLHETYEIHHLGINHRGDPHDEPWRIYPAGLRGDIYGVNRVEELLARVRPTLVFAACDPWILGRYAEVLQRHQREVRTVYYFPIEGTPLDPSLITNLRYADRLVVYNRTAAAAVADAVREARRDDPGFADRPLEIIPHGVDTAVYHPLPGVLDGDRRAARQQVLPPASGFDDAFIVLNANRNQPRKRIDLTIEGFARFAQGKPDNVKLYLHMGLEDVGWNLAVLARRHGIESRLILSSTESGVPTASEARLNLIYNACDVGLNTSTGEGWGLVSFEHGATGAAQIVGRHGACAELWDGAAELMEPSYRLTTERTLIDGWFVTPETVAAALERLYVDRELRLERGRQAYANATRPEYDWDAIAERWRALFDEVIRTHPYSAAALRREATGITSPR